MPIFWWQNASPELHGATAGAGKRRMEETGSRSATFLSRVKGLEGGRGELEGEPLRNVGKQLVAQYVCFWLYALYLLH